MTDQVDSKKHEPILSGEHEPLLNTISAMHANGSIKYIRVEYEGSGDSGNLVDITTYPTEAVYQLPDELKQLIEDASEEIVSSVGGGYELDDGGVSLLHRDPLLRRRGGCGDRGGGGGE